VWLIRITSRRGSIDRLANMDDLYDKTKVASAFLRNPERLIFIIIRRRDFFEPLRSGIDLNFGPILIKTIDIFGRRNIMQHLILAKFPRSRDDFDCLFALV